MRSEVMKGSIEDMNIEGYECTLFLPFGYNTSGKYYPVVYMNGGDHLQISEIISCIEPHFDVDCREFLFLSVRPKNWNDEYTPWPASALTKEGESFGGGALKYLNFLIKSIKTFIDENYHTKPEPENTALIGYSLGGLAALYSIYKISTFGKIGSLSGSLWFDGWKEFMDTNTPLNIDSKVYLSLGKGENHSRNQRIAKVDDCTRGAATILEEQLLFSVNLILEWNNGGHFTEIHQRYQRAILWLMHI
jgi:predicted alpha/beta superfamily hydrolase